MCVCVCIMKCKSWDINHFCLVYCSFDLWDPVVYYSQTQNMEKAEALVREMEEQGIDAPIDIYHSMMDGYTMIDNEEKCLIVFDRLKVQKACS